MVDTLEVEVAKRQLTKEILQDLGITKAVQSRFSNLPAQFGQLIDEYGKHYIQLYKYINQPYEIK